MQKVGAGAQKSGRAAALPTPPPPPPRSLIQSAEYNVDVNNSQFSWYVNQSCLYVMYITDESHWKQLDKHMYGCVQSSKNREEWSAVSWRGYFKWVRWTPLIDEQLMQVPNFDHWVITLVQVTQLSKLWKTGLSLRAGGRGFPPATMSVAPTYF